jgi:hypothetical protein
LLLGNRIAKRRDTAIAAYGTHREHQNAFNVIHEEFRVNSDFRLIASFSQILAFRNNPFPNKGPLI